MYLVSLIASDKHYFAAVANAFLEELSASHNGSIVEVVDQLFCFSTSHLLVTMAHSELNYL